MPSFCRTCGSDVKSCKFASFLASGQALRCHTDFKAARDPLSMWQQTAASFGHNHVPCACCRFCPEVSISLTSERMVCTCMANGEHTERNGIMAMA